MNCRWSIALAITLIAAPTLSSAQSAGAASGTLTQWCVPDTGSTGAFSLNKLRLLASSTDSLWVAMREVLGGIPPVPPEQVQRVVDEPLCERAARVLAQDFFQPDSAGAPHLEPVRLFRWGAWWTASPAKARAGEYGHMAYLKPDFRIAAVSLW